ncbi:uncharacterized protein LOC126379555 isoform X1 [Pectinophora gossypiella]|uniref:uncharacterized protein LOC126379555 isoform X1 n=1 Tax=Pectinophora gossypiella TaxID=13191 RepID=UPI00214EFCA7|nr:uncharacterized protein LOC126379555 isoform X1 [Pectinophora gossypiella]
MKVFVFLVIVTVVSIQGYPQPSLLGLRKEKCEKSTTSDFTKNTVSKNNEDSTKTTVKDVSNDGTTVTDSQETIKETSEVHQHSKDNESTHNTATKVQKKKARKGLFGSSDEEVTETDTVETDKTVTKDRDVTSQTTINKESKTFTNGDGSSKKTENSVDKVTSTNEKTKEDENLDKTKTQKIVKKKNQTLGLNGLVQVKKQHTDTITKTQREHEHNVKTSNSTNTTHYKTTNGTSETHDEDGYTKDSYGSSEQTSDGSSSSDESGSSDSSESVSKTSQDSVQISVLNLPPVTLEKNSDGKDKGALLKGLLKKKLHKGLLK